MFNKERHDYLAGHINTIDLCDSFLQFPPQKFRYCGKIGNKVSRRKLFTGIEEFSEKFIKYTDGRGSLISDIQIGDVFKGKLFYSFKKS